MSRISHRQLPPTFSATAYCAVLVMICAVGAHGANFSDGFRWSSTFADGTSLVQGDPTTLRWSIVPDSTLVDGGISDLVAYLDSHYGAGPGGGDLTQRPWFPTIDAQFARIAETTGLKFEYVPDDGATWGSIAATSGHGDIRLAGYDLSTPGELGRAELPAFGGDVLLDTANTSLANTATLGGVFQHEVGHTLGLLHATVPGTTVLMTTTAVPTDGPQFDDLFGLIRLYGDPYESGGGNDTPSTATPLGMLTSGVLVAVGSATDTQFVSPGDTDFATIDGVSDVDVYSFDVSTASKLDVMLAPRGPSYSFTPEGLAPQSMHAQLQSNLRFRLLASDGTTPLATLDRTGLGDEERIESFVLPAAGSYFLEITASENSNQFYRLNVAAEPTAMSDTSVVFHDRFDSATPALNASLDAAGRQGKGRLDSPYDFTTGVSQVGEPGVRLYSGKLKLNAVQGDLAIDSSTARPVRNFGAEVAGQRWLLSFNLEIDASTVSDQAVFAFVLDDGWPVGNPLGDDTPLTIQLAADGDYRIAEFGGNAVGEANRLGNQFADSYFVQVLVDETFAMPRITVGVNGVTRLGSEAVVFGSDERYVALSALTLAEMAIDDSLTALVDNLSVAVLSNAVSGDYNLDGVVNSADYTLWRESLGRSVLPGTAADGNANGVVDVADYGVWKAGFGSSSAARLVHAVPEPAGIGVLAMLAAACLSVKLNAIAVSRKKWAFTE